MKTYEELLAELDYIEEMKAQYREEERRTYIEDEENEEEDES